MAQIRQLPRLPDTARGSLFPACPRATPCIIRSDGLTRSNGRQGQGVAVIQPESLRNRVAELAKRVAETHG